MKIVLRIFDILLVAALVAAAFSLAAGNFSVASGLSASDRPTTIVNAAGQPTERFEGERDGGSITGGLLEVLATVAKLTAITILVLLIQKAFRFLGNAQLISAQR